MMKGGGHRVWGVMGQQNTQLVARALIGVHSNHAAPQLRSSNHYMDIAIYTVVYLWLPSSLHWTCVYPCYDSVATCYTLCMAPASPLKGAAYYDGAIGQYLSLWLALWHIVCMDYNIEQLLPRLYSGWYVCASTDHSKWTVMTGRLAGAGFVE